VDTSQFKTASEKLAIDNATKGQQQQQQQQHFQQQDQNNYQSHAKRPMTSLPK
jgi:hypothetical protein